MTTSLATTTCMLLLAGMAVAQQPKKAKSAATKSTTISANDLARSNPSAANTYDGTNGASTGANLTNDQRQGAGNARSQPTKVDATSSTRTTASGVKARKKSPKQ